MKAIANLLFLLTFFVSCNASPDSTRNKILISEEVEKEYPAEIEKLGAQKRYDNAKWALYCIYCDMHIRFRDPKHSIDTTTTYGQLPLRFHHLKIVGDTMEINFFFYYDNQKVDEFLTDFFPYSGAIFRGAKDSLAFYSSRGHASYFWFSCEDPKNCKERRVIPEQPEVVKYIKENKNKIDPWFLKEAIKRGIIER